MADLHISETDQQQLQSNLVTALRADAGAKDTFCKCWPCAKNVLEIILGLPQLPPGLVTVLRAIVKAGDLAQGTVCPH